MEDPANKLKIDKNLRIEGDIKDQIYNKMNEICIALLEEEKSINTEIRQLSDNKITMDQIQSEDEEIELNGISQTSILVYLNEIGLLEHDADSSKMSHKAFPGNAIVNYIKA